MIRLGIPCRALQDQVYSKGGAKPPLRSVCYCSFPFPTLLPGEGSRPCFQCNHRLVRSMQRSLMHGYFIYLPTTFNLYPGLPPELKGSTRRVSHGGVSCRQRLQAKSFTLSSDHSDHTPKCLSPVAVLFSISDLSRLCTENKHSLIRTGDYPQSRYFCFPPCLAPHTPFIMIFPHLTRPSGKHETA